MAIERNGDLYAWGYGDNGWLGLQPPRDMPVVDSDNAALQPKCDYVHTMGFDSRHNVLVPQRVKCLANSIVEKVRCGGGHTIVFTSSRTEGRKSDDSIGGGVRSTTTQRGWPSSSSAAKSDSPMDPKIADDFDDKQGGGGGDKGDDGDKDGSGKDKKFVVAKGYFGADPSTRKGGLSSQSDAKKGSEGILGGRDVDSKTDSKGLNRGVAISDESSHVDEKADVTAKRLQQVSVSMADVDASELTAQLIGWCRHGKIAEVSYALSRTSKATKATTAIKAAAGARDSGYVDINTRDTLGNTPLIACCQNGHEAIVHLLVDSGADIHASNNKGNTPLHFCLAYGYQEIARFLIDSGADEFVTNKDGLTPYEGLVAADLDKI